jgi:clathrin heavy chain
MYERRGHFEEIIMLLEAGLSLERAHMGIFTEPSILLSKYKPAKCKVIVFIQKCQALTTVAVMEHLKLFVSHINIPKVIKAVEKAHLWPELVFLYIKYDEFVCTRYERLQVAQAEYAFQDNAALAMIERSADALEHNQFKDVIVRAANVEMYVAFLVLRHSHSSPFCSYYKALTLYLQEHPTLLNDLLSVLIPRIDHSRVVHMFGKMGHIPLIRSYLIAVQHVGTLYTITFLC